MNFEMDAPLKTTGWGMIAMCGCRETAPIQEPSSSLASNSSNDPSSQKDCTCISCRKIGRVSYYSTYISGKGFKCRFPSCPSFQGNVVDKFYAHEKSHYGRPGKYTCLEHNCQAVTKHFGDLKRHDKALHCTDPEKEQFPCPVLWCKYSGNNGFARKDKLESHCKNIHVGKPGPAKAGRVLKPAALRPKIPGVEGSASKQKE